MARVLYYHQFFSTRAGTAGTRSYEFARALLEHGHEVVVVCGEHSRGALALPKDPQFGGTRGVIDGIDVIALPLHYSNSQSLRERAQVFLGFALRGIRVAFAEPHDVLFATSTPLTAGIPGIARRLLGRRTRFVFEVRDLWPELPRALGVSNPLVLFGMDALEWLSYRCADRCVGLAPGIVAGIQRRASPKLAVELIPNGCDLELFHPRQRGSLASVAGSAIQAGDFVAGFTGAHGVANGLDAVLEVAEELRRRGRQDIKFLLIGDGSEKPRLQALAEKRGLSCCLFLPLMPKTELSRVTASLDVGLQLLKNVPAFYYGTSPNKFFDYLAAGIPVLTNYPGWIADLVQTHDAGVAVPPDDVRAFADALEALSADPTRRTRQGQNARQLAQLQFSRDTLAARFVQFVTG
jgi:glycosyltransferase involved in cell wall biosynthesis